METKTIETYAPYDRPSQHPEYKAFIEWLKGEDPWFRHLPKMTVVPPGDRRKDGWVRGDMPQM